MPNIKMTIGRVFSYHVSCNLTTLALNFYYTSEFPTIPSELFFSSGSFNYRASGRSRQIRGKNGRFHRNFAGIFEASFAEKQLVKNGRFRGSFQSKFRWKAIGFALI